MLTQTYRLKVLAFTFDNGFISEQAKVNILKMTDTLGAASIFFRPPFDDYETCLRPCCQRKPSTAPKPWTGQAPSAPPVSAFVKAMILKTALSYHIPIVAYGWSPGQAPIASAVMQTNPRLQSISVKIRQGSPHGVAGDWLKPYFLNEDDLAMPRKDGR